MNFSQCFIASFLCQPDLVMGYIKHFYHLRTLSLATHLWSSLNVPNKEEIVVLVYCPACDFCFIDSLKSDESNSFLADPISTSLL